MPFSPTEQIAAVRVAAGIDTLLPICHDIGIAGAIVGAARTSSG